MKQEFFILTWDRGGRGVGVVSARENKDDAAKEAEDLAAKLNQKVIVAASCIRFIPKVVVYKDDV
jgi:hypothetical protein